MAGLALVFGVASKALGRDPEFQVAGSKAKVEYTASAAEGAFGFGRSLFQEGDYYRAITEFKRGLFEEPESDLAPSIRLMIGISYSKGEKYQAAVAAFEDARRDGGLPGKMASLFKAETLLAWGKPLESESLLVREFPADPSQGGPEVRIQDRAIFARAWALLAQGRGSEARDLAKTLTETGDFSLRSAKFVDAAAKQSKIPVRKPWLGAILSAIIPGLGQSASGRVGDGLSALVVNGLFAWGTAESFSRGRNATGTLLAVIGSGWYAGNIYAGANAAARFNRDRRSRYFEAAWRECGIPPMEEAVSWPKSTGERP